MKYGVSTVVADKLPQRKAYRTINKSGFRQIELVCRPRLSGNWFENPDRTLRLLEKYGLMARSVHAPLWGCDNSNPVEAVRLKSVEASASVFSAAAAVGAEAVICHPNAPSEIFKVETYADSFARSRDSLSILSERAKTAGVKMAVENLPHRRTPRPASNVEDVLKMIDGLGDHVGICLDAGHANASQLDPAEEARIAGSRLFCVHIQDNDGIGEDQHLFPGKGTVDWPKFIAALDEFAPDCIRTFEIHAYQERPKVVLKNLRELAEEWS